MDNGQCDVNENEKDCQDTFGKSVELEIIRRKLPEYTGIYVEGQVEEVQVMFTIDTGATSTIVSNKVFEAIPKEKRPELKLGSGKRLVNADGRPIDYKGQAHLELQLGPISIEKIVTIAEIEDEVLLGADILLKDPTGPADLILSKGWMVFRGVQIPVEKVGILKPIRRAHVADDYTVPGMSEAVLEVYVDRVGDGSKDECLLIEASPVFTEHHQLVQAPSLVDLTAHTTGTVRVFNPFPHPVTVNQDTVIGYATEVDQRLVQYCMRNMKGKRETLVPIDGSPCRHSNPI